MLYTLLAAVVVAVALAYLIIWYQHRRRERQRTAEQRQAKIDQIRMLARSGISQQVDLTEVVMRIKYLLDHLDNQLSENQQIAVIYQMYDAAAPLATHRAREALSPQERLQQDNQREKLESFYEKPVINVLQYLLAEDFWADSS